MKNTKTWRRRAAALLLTSASAALVAACGSSTSSSTQSSTAAAAKSTPASAKAATPATGPTVHVYSVFAEGTPGGSAPEVGGGVRAAFRYLNAHGGIGPSHAKVAVQNCNTQLTPQGEIQCAKKAAADPKALAVVSPLLVIAPQQFMSVMDKAKLPVVNLLPIDPDTPKNPMSFALWSPGLGPSACAALMPKETGLKKLALVGPSLPTTAYMLGLAAKAAEKGGSTVTTTTTFPLTATDLSPFVSKAAASGAQATVITGAPQQVGGWLTTALRLGKSQPTCAFDGQYPTKVLIGLGQQAKDIYTAGFFPDVSTQGYPMLQELRDQAQAEVASGDKVASLDPAAVTQQVAAGWLGSQVVRQVADQVKGPLSRANFLSALQQAKVSFGSGSEAVLPPIDFSKPNSDARWPRLFNTRMILKKWDPAKKAFVIVDSQQPVTGEAVVGAQ